MEHPRRQLHIGFLVNLIVLICILVLVSVSAARINAETSTRQEESLETALSQDITTCYALEGFYPPDLQYMKDHYGLTFDENDFYVDYRPIAANIRPDYTVIRK